MGSLYNLKRGEADSEDIRVVPVAVAANGAITLHRFGRKVYFITKASAAAITLPAPTSDVHDGIEIEFVSMTAAAHTVTCATTGFNDGGASGDVGTFGAAKGNGFRAIAYQGDWMVVENRNVTFA